MLSSEDETLLVWRDARGGVSSPNPVQAKWHDSPFLVLDLGLDIVDGVGGLNLEGDSLSGESLNKNLHG